MRLQWIEGPRFEAKGKRRNVFPVLVDRRQKEIANEQDEEKLFLRVAQKGSDTRRPETGNPSRRGGTECCPLREEIPRNESYMEVRRNDEG